MSDAEYVQVGWLKNAGGIVSNRSSMFNRKAELEGWAPVFARRSDVEDRRLRLAVGDS